MDGKLIEVIPKNLNVLNKAEKDLRSLEINQTVRKAILHLSEQTVKSDFSFYSNLKQEMSHLSPELYQFYVKKEPKLRQQPYGISLRRNKAN